MEIERIKGKHFLVEGGSSIEVIKMIVAKCKFAVDEKQLRLVNF